MEVPQVCQPILMRMLTFAFALTADRPPLYSPILTIRIWKTESEQTFDGRYFIHLL